MCYSLHRQASVRPETDDTNERTNEMEYHETKIEAKRRKLINEIKRIVSADIADGLELFESKRIPEFIGSKNPLFYGWISKQDIQTMFRIYYNYNS